MTSNTMPDNPLPLGKLPVELLSRLLEHAPLTDKRILLGPGIGLDCAVVDVGSTLLVMKSDPITFASDEIGWYAVQVNANDIATTGAQPRWMLATVLLPEKHTSPAQVEKIADQLFSACRELDISLIGGHTEITYGLERPIVMCTLIGEVAHDHLITPRGAMPGDALLLTKGVPIEATTILAREFSERLLPVLGSDALSEAAAYLHKPGISVLRDAQIACRAGQVTAMHDPTEGGLAAALWELAQACGHTLIVDARNVQVPPLSARICQVFGLDPLAAIASGALLLTVKSTDSGAICSALQSEGIDCSQIGVVEAGSVAVWDESSGERRLLPRPLRDEITRVYE